MNHVVVVDHNDMMQKAVKPALLIALIISISVMFLDRHDDIIFILGYGLFSFTHPFAIIFFCLLQRCRKLSEKECDEIFQSDSKHESYKHKSFDHVGHRNRNWTTDPSHPGSITNPSSPNSSFHSSFTSSSRSSFDF